MALSKNHEDAAAVRTKQGIRPAHSEDPLGRPQVDLHDLLGWLAHTTYRPRSRINLHDLPHFIWTGELHWGMTSANTLHSLFTVLALLLVFPLRAGSLPHPNALRPSYAPRLPRTAPAARCAALVFAAQPRSCPEFALPVSDTE